MKADSKKKVVFVIVVDVHDHVIHALHVFLLVEILLTFSLTFFLNLEVCFGNWNWKCFVQLELPLEKILNLPYYWRAIRRSGFPHLAQP